MDLDQLEHKMGKARGIWDTILIAVFAMIMVGTALANVLLSSASEENKYLMSCEHSGASKRECQQTWDKWRMK